MAKLYKSLDPAIRIWQDRWPAGYTTNKATVEALTSEVSTWVPDPLQYEGDQKVITTAAEKGVTFYT